MSQEQPNAEEEEEEDWSSFLVTGSLTAGETNEDRSSSYGFQHYPQQKIQWVNGTVIELQHMEELSPMDMVQLSQASHDATGHKVWWGAHLFLWALVSETNHNRLFVEQPSTNKNVLELGCGTGLAGIALCLAFPTVVRSMVFTDADQDVLNLCRINCQRNLAKQQQQPQKPEWSTQQLVWGKEEEEEDHVVDCNSNSRYDIVLATDVLYSVSLLEPLLRTVRAHLQRGGFFWLSHVPRATLDGDHATVSSTPRLEWHIQQQAHQHGLSLSQTIRPHQLLTTTSSSSSSFSLGQQDKSCGCTLQQLQETGAAILIFQKQ